MFKILTFIVFLIYTLDACNDKKEVLPPPEGVYHSAFPNFGSSEDSVSEERIKNFQNLVGQKIVWAYFSNNWWNGIIFPKKEVEIIYSQGVIPFIRMMPRRNYDNGVDTHYNLQNIIDGKFDNELRMWARHAKLTSIPLMIEFGTEVNGDWFPWCGIYNGGGKTDGFGDKTLPDGPERFKFAYIHIINIFREEKVDNVTWVFHVNAYSFPENSWNKYSYYYPGDEYIDWIGVSVYGPQLRTERWQLFSSIMEDIYIELTQLSDTKPIAVLEFGVTDGHPQGRKSDWIRDAFLTIKNIRYNRIKAISWWHSRFINNDGSICNMNIDSSPDALYEYRECVSSPFFVTEAVIKD